MTSNGFFIEKARRLDHFFNMVECALALAVVAIGVVSIVALFPVGMEAQRDAIGETFASQTADMLIHYQATLAKTAWNATLSNTPTSKPGSTETGLETWSTSTSKMTPTTILTPVPGANPSIFKVEAINQKTNQADFSGAFRVWRSDVGYKNISTGVLTNLSTDRAQALTVEVSWPSQAPYPTRKRALYYLEVFNSN